MPKGQHPKEARPRPDALPPAPALRPRVARPLRRAPLSSPPERRATCVRAAQFLKALELPEDEEAHGYKKKVMRYSSTYRHTGVIGH